MQPPPTIVEAAIRCASQSPCRSQRGVVIWQPASDTRPGFMVASAHNAPPYPLTCDRSQRCRDHCRRAAVHAEQRALLAAGTAATDAELVHVKVVDGELVASGGPSCVECSKLALVAGIAHVWLYHADGWARYSALDFHRLSCAAQGIVLG